MKLIDKEKIVAEIKGYIFNYKEIVAKINRNDSTWVDSVSMIDAKIDVLQHVLFFLDTLEVKEVDLENYVKGRIDYPFIGYDFPNIYPNYKELKDYCDKNGIKDEDKVKIIIIKDGIL